MTVAVGFCVPGAHQQKERIRVWNTALSLMTDHPRALRLWPGIVAVALQWIAWIVVPAIEPGPAASYVRPLGVLATGVAVLLWWAFFSRAPRLERWTGVALMLTSIAVVGRLVHDSLRAGMMSLVFVFNVLPPLCLAFVVWAVATRRMSSGRRRTAMVAVILIASGGWIFLRSDGMTGGGTLQLAWRWSETAEERLLAARVPQTLRPKPPTPESESATPEPALGPDAIGLESAPEEPLRQPEPEPATPPAWPGFRGPNRDAAVRGVRIATDWNLAPPIELWRRPIGPGWSSFAVRGERLYTQEQRADEEFVSCYDLDTGEIVWSHADPVRFWEAIGGPGPRATPTLHGERVYALGATGILNALDAANGTVHWSRNVGTDAQVQVPGWGFAASPLIVGDIVVAAAEGRLIGYDLDSGELLWLGPKGGSGYSSPHLLEIGGVAQVVLMSSAGASSVDPSNGVELWRYSSTEKSRIVQPAPTPDFDLLVSDGESSGIRRIAVARRAEQWTAEERWTSFRLKPYFNDFVVHKGRAIGFDGRILAAINLDDGSLQWKGGRYGQGQMLLLADQNLLLVVTEEGEAALVDADADSFVEIAKAPLIAGKTWNHPALAGDVLLVRNGEEMAAFRLTLR